jgi:hypothetical protein
MSLLAEFCSFIVARKKFWLLPVVLVVFIFGSLLVLSQGSVVAPFIYAVF